ncbi:Molybdenum cofactor sulfurase family protein [Zea mays]|uniref:Molybdenum cofactor sulfurase family protein n=1 Tax=Zea mays TaxID=4577 RepID=A0A1D6EVE4_MAIZE|nr:Molybdenum cofactor sulfurase family protein [Zea mays]|eukprot:XP_023157458.1 mitochondrial amidoxime reducing component 2 isoform X1 [Zea mays]
MAMEKAASSLLGGGGGEPAATVKSIFIYPIKSCRGLAVSQALIISTGFRWDRQWVVVNGKGRAYTQRVEPKLALVQVELPPEAFAEDWQPTPYDHLVIRAPGMDTLKIPLAAEHTTIDDVSVWEWSGSAYDEGAEVSEWFSTYFGKPSRLVRFKEASETRPTDPYYGQGQGYKIMFTDRFPFLIASQVPSINQEDGIPGTEPNETLQTFRSDQVLRPSHKNKRQVYFGVNLVCKESLSGKDEGKIIKVGDPVYVVQAFDSSNEALV